MLNNRFIVWIAMVWIGGIYLSLFSSGGGRWLVFLAYLILICLLRWLGIADFRQVGFLLVIFLLSIVYHAWHASQHRTDLTLEDGTEASLRGMIQSRITVDGDRLAFTMRVTEVVTDEMPLAVSERVQVNIRLLSQAEQEMALRLQRGGTIGLRGHLQVPPSATNWDVFDYQQYLSTQRIHWILETSGLSDIQLGPAPTFHLSTWLGWFDRLQAQLGQRIELLFRKDLQSLMKSQTIGLRDDLDPELYRMFSHVGLSHILAISGLHVGIFIGTLLYVLRMIGLTRERSLVCCMGLIPFYVLITGAAPPVIRAGLMALISLEAARRKQLKDGLSILSGAVMLMLIWNPYMLTTISFQLSVIVTCGLILFVQPVSRLLPIRWKALQGTVGVTLVAQCISFPMTIYYFNHFSLLSFPVNLLFVPLLSLLVIPLTMGAITLSFLHRTLGVGLAKMAEGLTDFVLAAIDQLIRIDPFGTTWASPPVWWIALYYAMFAVFISCLMAFKKATILPLSRQDVRRSREKWLMFSLASGICLGLLIFFAYHPDRWLNEAEVSFLDVGQGDAILVRTPKQRYILIDSGGTMRFDKPGEDWRLRSDPYEVGKDRLVPLLKKRGVRQLDYVILTHLDQDHVGGALAVLQNIPVRSILFNGTLNEQETTYHLFREALTLGIPLFVPESGHALQLDQHTDVLFLHPRNFASDIAIVNRQNDQSTVFLLCIFKHCLLMTGDIEERTEVGLLSWLTREGSELWSEWQMQIDRHSLADLPQWPVDILKVAHHGSRTSTSEAWLNFWQPASAVISAGRHNRYGHPHSVVLERLLARDIPIYRTDEQGEIRFKITPKGISVSTKQ